MSTHGKMRVNARYARSLEILYLFPNSSERAVAGELSLVHLREPTQTAGWLPQPRCWPPRRAAGMALQSWSSAHPGNGDEKSSRPADFSARDVRGRLRARSFPACGRTADGRDAERSEGCKPCSAAGCSTGFGETRRRCGAAAAKERSGEPPGCVR